MNFEIITDSCATLPREVIKQLDIHILSLFYYIDDKEFMSYEEGKQNDLSYFYDRLHNKADIRTSLINSEAAGKQIEEIVKQEKDILYIGFSSGLSGSFQAVAIAMDELKEKYPERKIYYVDTLSASLGQGLLVYYAASKRKEGMDIDVIFDWVQQNRLRMCHWFSVNDLFFLKRGGRVSTVAAIFGSALSIKPVLHVDNEGHLIVTGKARGRKKALDEMACRLFETVENSEQQVMAISHADCEEDANYLMNHIKEKHQVKEFIINQMEPVIASHTGPGCIALFFMGKER